ncbi:glucosidase II beta subunit-like protein-domain-containing protein, partial [Microdochium bolleyi]
MRHFQLLPLLALSQQCRGVTARQPGFSIHQDLLAYPQFEVVISEAYISEADAQALLDKAEAHSSSAARHHPASQTEIARNDRTASGEDDDTSREAKAIETYEIMSAPPHRYLCAIPIIEAPPAPNKTATELAKAEEAKELARASAHGWDLVNELEGTCLHYVMGWWSYTFCYGNSVVQFHALPGSMKIGKPVRDPQTMDYVLGRQQQQEQRQQQANGEIGDTGAVAPNTPSQQQHQSQNVMELQVKGDQRYMVQRLDAGTICDLTGRERTIEIQYHCSPGSTQDRIGWIKEVTTCAYLMVVNTPRLCNDVAFLPPKETKANIITCRDIIPEEGVSEWRQRKMVEVESMLTGKGANKGPATIGGIVVGGRKTFGDEVARLSPPRGMRQQAEAVQKVLNVVAKGSGKEKTFDVLNDEDLAALGIDRETIDELHDQMEKVAGEKDWKLELVE